MHQQTSVLPTEVFPIGTKINGHGHLEIGGCDVVDVARRCQTPLYVFDETSIRLACRNYKAAFANSYDRQADISYACKAFRNAALVRLLCEEGLGCLSSQRRHDVYG